MRVNPRMFEVRAAHNRLTGLVLDFREKSDLTDIEYLQWLAGEQQSTLRYMLREERHGDAGIPADETQGGDDDD